MVVRMTGSSSNTCSRLQSRRKQLSQRRKVSMIKYSAIFDHAVGRLREEGRYRVFADIRRTCGAFPRAVLCKADAHREITVWCSNDYLGMGQSDVVGWPCTVRLTR